MDINYRLKDAAILIIAFLLSVIIRWPNFNRPLSKHHDFVNACTLNGIISWQEAGGASKFNFVPLMTYQGPANRLLAHGINTDSIGNEYYLSVGAGWYIVAYAFFKLFHATPTPMGLVYINLFFNVVTLISFYVFLRFIQSKYILLPRKFPLWCCLIFSFMPGPLWYFGNLYVQSALVIPFALFLTLLFLKFSFSPQKLTAGFTALFFIAGITTIYIDWFGFFLLAAFFVYSASQYFLSKKSAWIKMGAICCVTGIAGVALVFFQFAHFLGWHNVVGYWQNRVSDRSFYYDEGTPLGNLVRFFSNFLGCTGIASLCAFTAIVVFIKKKNAAFPFVPVVIWAMASIAYNIVFYNWSFVHEFSMVPISVLIAMLAAYCCLTIIPQKYSAIIWLIFVLDIFQYYYINRPGNISRNGTPYNIEKLLGEEIKKEVPPDARIFTSGKSSPIVEYYAHRSFLYDSNISLAEAQKRCDSFNVTKAVWLDIVPDHINKVVVLR